MSYIISTTKLSSWECDTLEKGMNDIANFVVENDEIEPTITEIYLYEENKSVSQKELLAFENKLLRLINDCRAEKKIDDLDFKRHGYA